ERPVTRGASADVDAPPPAPPPCWLALLVTEPVLAAAAAARLLDPPPLLQPATPMIVATATPNARCMRMGGALPWGPGATRRGSTGHAGRRVALLEGIPGTYGATRGAVRTPVPDRFRNLGTGRRPRQSI